MAVIRCPQCNAPMTFSESRTGSCPVCQSPLASAGIQEGPSTGGGGGASMSAEREFTPLRSRPTGYASKPLASIGSRFAAFLLDQLIGNIVGIPYTIGYFMMIATMDPNMGRRGGMGGMGSAPEPNPLALILMAVGGLLSLAFLIYQVVIISMHGQSVGKKFMKIRIVRYDDDSNPGFVSAVLMRMLVPGLLASCTCGIFMLVNYLYIFGAERRCVHDYMAGTKVVEA